MASVIRRFIKTTAAPGAVGPYSQAVVVDKTVYLSGQVGLDPATGILVAGGVEPETHQVMKNMRAVLQEAGIDFGNVVKTTVYLADINDYTNVNTIYLKYFTDSSKYPARAAFQVAALPKAAQVEIEAIAVLGTPDDQ